MHVFVLWYIWKLAVKFSPVVCNIIKVLVSVVGKSYLGMQYD